MFFVSIKLQRLPLERDLLKGNGDLHCIVKILYPYSEIRLISNLSKCQPEDRNSTQFKTKLEVKVRHRETPRVTFRTLPIAPRKTNHRVLKAQSRVFGLF